jgi:excisionase family DNA binding protein
MSERKTSSGEYLDPRAFGELLDLNRESVYRAISRGELHAVRVGRAIRLPRSQLADLLAEVRDPDVQ